MQSSSFLAVGRVILGVGLLGIALPGHALAAQGKPVLGVRVELRADRNWRFTLGDPAGAEAPDFNDAQWRNVDLPHDWSIEGTPDPSSPTKGGEGYYPAGIGWYRKSFTVPAAWNGKRVSVEFDGVYRNAAVYLNGKKLGEHPNGYTSFTFDLTPGLKPGPNTLAVRVDNADQPNSRWYSGSGIYRHVRMVVTSPTHVAYGGVLITTPKCSEASGTVHVASTLMNETAAAAPLIVRTAILDAAGKEVKSGETTVSAEPNASVTTEQTLTVDRPRLWSPATPVLYAARVQILQQGRVIDELTTPFGIRTLAWSAEKGLLLNGTSIKINGGSVHADNGPLGAASFDKAEIRRVHLLKAAGMNAVRTAHNAPSPAFLDACDRLGLLVMDEVFDTWETHKVKYDAATTFKDWWQRDLASLMLRDRNHPSVVMWSMGNEIPDGFVARGPEIARQLTSFARSLDSSRPLTQAIPGSTSLPSARAIFSMLDIGGYNYSLGSFAERDHKEFPSRLMVVTESYPAEAYPDWAMTQAHPYVLGDFVWTSMDYLGESGIGGWSYGSSKEATQADQIFKFLIANPSGVDAMNISLTKGKLIDDSIAAAGPVVKLLIAGYPWHAADCGDIDLIGTRKDQSFYRDILWNGGDRVHIAVRTPAPDDKQVIAIGWGTPPSLPSWSWKGHEGKAMQVEVYSAADRVRLTLNGKVLGEQLTGPAAKFKAAFMVPYQPGVLKAIAFKGDRAVAEDTVETAEDSVRLRLITDHTELQADGQDLAYILVEAVDRQGRLQTGASNDVQFQLAGAATIVAVGNGDGQDNSSYQGLSRKLFHGKALVIVRAGHTTGRAKLAASAADLQPAAMEFKIVKSSVAAAELP